MNIGDKITVTNRPQRMSKQIVGQRYETRWTPFHHDAYEAIFIGWTNVWAGEFVEKRIVEHDIIDPVTGEVIGKTRDWAPGRMITKYAVRVAVVQPCAGNQWRKPQRTILPNQPHACPCGKQADPGSGYCPEHAYDNNMGMRLATTLKDVDRIEFPHHIVHMFEIEGRGSWDTVIASIHPDEVLKLRVYNWDEPIDWDEKTKYVYTLGSTVITWLQWLKQNPKQENHVASYVHYTDNSIPF